PSIEWRDRADDPDTDVHRGHDGVTEFLASIYEAAEWRIELEEYTDAGEFVVVTVHLLGQGRASGASFDERQVPTYRVRGGRITELREHRDRAEALKAV